jgi:arabinose-5-phosphate isomerase
MPDTLNLRKNIKTIAKNVLINEANAINKLVNYIDDDFEACVQQILQSKGRVVITGIGKSAIIAQKIVATLNSTGTPSLFLHAADAIHGDLGMVQSEDFVICLSKSGNTPEIKVLVPLLKRRGYKLAALVSNTDSYLAKQADFVLNATIDQEACPNNLAPTTSTTAHLVMGDALAVCLLEAREFTSADFAKYHPGGSLGKQLYLKVIDAISNNELPSVKEEASFKEVIYEISAKRLGATAVVNEKGELAGIITDGDLRRLMEKREDFTSAKAREFMTKSPIVLEADEYAVKALQIMQSKNITHIVIVENGKPVGFLHLHDLLKEGIA